MVDFPPEALKSIALEVANLLKQRKETVSVAETASGGLVSASLLSTPGASTIYKGGLTLYTLESRIAFAGWTAADLKAYRGPSAQIVAGLAAHVRGTLGSTYTLCESGTAGPTGGNTPNRKPGFVALAVSTADGTFVKEGDSGLGAEREGNMVAFAVMALTLLKEVMLGETEAVKL